jgi:hypothetical protein
MPRSINTHSRARHLRNNYGISERHYNWLFTKQDGTCAICKSKLANHIWGKLNIDHCHKTKTVRGLLCSPCNMGLGKFNDDPELLAKARDYLISNGLSSEMKLANIPAPRLGIRGWPSRDNPDTGHKIRRKTADVIRDLRKRFPKVCTQQWLATKFGVSQALVSAILRNKVWKTTPNNKSC